MKLFDNISNREKIKFLKSLDVDILVLKKGNQISSILKSNNFVGFVLSGNVEIIKEDYNGNKSLIESLEIDDVLGTIMSSLTNKEYIVEAKEDSKIIIIDYTHIINYQNNNNTYNQFLKNLLNITNEKMKDNNNHINVLTKKSIRNKLLEYFEIISAKNNSRNVYLPFSFTDLAAYLSVDRSAMSRELSYLKDEGLIEVKGKRITLLNKTRFDKDYEQIHF